MTLRSKKAIFGLALLAGFLLVLGIAGYDYWERQPKVEISILTEEVGLSGQIDGDAVPEIVARGYKTIIDLRPDGEFWFQPSSEEIDAAARAHQASFFYIPIPHGNAVPDDAVAALTKAMATSPGPILLYCRSGRRAARAWSLVEAARPGGLDGQAIMATVKAAGHSVDDLAPAIDARIGSRHAHAGAGQ